MLKRSLFVCALLMSASNLPAYADDVSARVDQLEEQVRQLTGQIEQLNFQLKQMQAQKKLGAVDAAPSATQQALTQPPAAQVMQKPVAVAAAPAPIVQQQAATAAPATLALRKKPLTNIATQQGVETIDETPVQQPAAPVVQSQISGATQLAGAAPAPRLLGATTKAAYGNDGGFQGQVLVAPGSDDNAVAPAVADGSAASDTAVAQPVSLQAETPDDLFLRSEKALLQLQFADAEQGFKDFVAKYPEHNLAGSAEFKLGETFWAQQDYAAAAQAYLSSYKQWPKGRRAPDSLLKLGLSMARLEKKDQACSLLSSVDSEYPSAVEVKKRAQAEFKREGC
jgi:tol-pal system protein YbgF